jgi:hypothetical protein
MSDSDYGTPFDENTADPIDDWSRAVFEACRDWPLADSSRWFRWDEGWIYLRIEEVDGERLEPLFAIELDTHDGQVNLDFGSWCTPVSPFSGPLEDAAEYVVARARELIEGWLSGDVKLASYSDETGWRGSKIVYGGELPAAIEPVPVEIGGQARVIVKTPRRSEWRSWIHIGDGIWIESEINEG